jgi:hypothetical protein
MSLIVFAEAGVDQRNEVFTPNVDIKCQHAAVVKLAGSLARDGCGTQPQAMDLYAEVLDGAKLGSARSVPITVPLCLAFAPDEGFSDPP